MGESRLLVEELLAPILQLVQVEDSVERGEALVRKNADAGEKSPRAILSRDVQTAEFIEMLKNFEAVRKKWLHSELELKKYKELLVKSDVAKAALEVKLKHARNQLDVEMKKRHKVESDYQYLQRQMQLMCDILVHDSKSSSCLNDEQKSLLATFDRRGANTTLQRSSKRLSVIDESSFLSHSDISYDRTDDDVDLDTTVIKPLKSRARERRRPVFKFDPSSARPCVPTVGAPVGKRSRGGTISTELLERKTIDEEVETIVKASMTTVDSGGQVHMKLGITQESPDNPSRSITQECAVSLGDQTSVWLHCDNAMVQLEAEGLQQDSTAPSCRVQKTLRHIFLSKTVSLHRCVFEHSFPLTERVSSFQVIRPETCVPCGKRIRFGKVAVKCRSCRVVAHPECKQKLPIGLLSWQPCDRKCSSDGTSMFLLWDSLERFAPPTHPRVPQLIVDCVAEIERRGLQERGLYRVPGGERLVKELRERFLQGKSALVLNKVQDIHVVCGLLKDFLRKLKEPLITFRLHKTFMEASELADEDRSWTVLSQAVAELPKANRDTLAFLMLHLHKVMRSPQCQMDLNNLARIFGPTIVGHGMSEPSPTTIMRDTNVQPKVVCRLLSLPEDFWRRILTDHGVRLEEVPLVCSKKKSQDEGHGRLFKPLTSPELHSCYKTSTVGSVRGRILNPRNAVPDTGQVDSTRKFFTSPS
ncbi:Rac GTPase-activating protein 1 [Oryzias melastigma]|uniref:Rac GTPase-activating protein 1 n=1 Tax=Oryzias melastigma TaxID=30732 RepID=A0A834F8J1_ORYME|nr:Rac GTPase-activating protein 1 [Oryzias melastigma]